MLKTNRSDPVVFLLAAGFGTRLRPRTDTIPKALVPVHGKPLLEWHLERLQREGFTEVLINTHYLAPLLRQYVGDGSKWGMHIHCIHEDPILDTGGAVKNALPFISTDEVVVINSDAIFGTDFSVRELINEHRDCAPALATLVLRQSVDAEQFGLIGTDRQGRIVSFLKTGNPLHATTQCMFTGAQIISRSAFAEFCHFGEVFSLTRDFYCHLVGNQCYLSSFLYSGYWNDVGTEERLREAEAAMKQIAASPATGA